MACDCPVCKGRDLNQEGIDFAIKEVIPYVKEYLLKLRHKNHPMPCKYAGFTASLMCFSQALVFDKAHGNYGRKYYTHDKNMLYYAKRINEKFHRVTICDIKDMSEENVQEVCEFNAASVDK